MTRTRIDRPNPTANAHEEKTMEMKSKLSTLWIFAALSYLYCDVVSLMDPQLLPQYLAGNVNGLHFTAGFLLGASILIEIPIAMVVASRVLPRRIGRWANVVAGSLMTVVQLASLFAGAPAGYYLFFSVVEIATTALIVAYAWKWTEPVRASLTSPSLAG